MPMKTNENQSLESLIAAIQELLYKKKNEKLIKENSTKKGNIKLKNIKLSTAKNKINSRTSGNLSNTINQTLSNQTISQSRMLNKYRKSLN